MKHKLLSLLLALAASVGIVFATEIDGINYTLDDEKLTATVISKSPNYAGAVVIPSSVTYSNETYSVTEIGADAFYHCNGLISVTIPNSVTEIGSHTFQYCSDLLSVSISNSVTSIGEYIFSGCTSLTSVTIPNSVTSIGNGAFWGCTGLTSITIPNSVTSIGIDAFSGCTGLTSITIPNSVTSIGEYIFHGCTSLTSVTIPNSVTSIGKGAFWGCTGLTSLTIPNSVTSIGENAFNGVPNIVYSGSASGSPWGARSLNGYVDGWLVYSDNTKIDLLACSTAATGKITIPNSVTWIGEFAFSNCSGLSSVTIGNSVTGIGWSAFTDCTSLTSITIPNSITSIGEAAFSGCSGLTFITIPNSVTDIGEEVFNNCHKLISISVDANNDNYSDIDGVLFNKNKKQLIRYPAGKSGTSYTIPNSVTSIGEAAFSGCTGLISITIPNSVNYIRNNAFSGCSSLTSVTIPTSVTSIGYGAFGGCTGLTSITIPNSITSIGNGAFGRCTGLTSITIPNSVTSIGIDAFSGCTGLTSITIPNSVTSIGENAFNGVLNITYSGSASGSPWGAINVNGYVDGWLIYSDDTKTNLLACSATAIGEIIIPNSVKTIGDGAFYQCSGLTSVTISNSVTSIGYAAFAMCSNLTSVTIPNSVTNIGDYAFWGCSGLTSISIGDSVTSIGESVFLYCTSLTSVTIGNSVTSIGSRAFEGCTSLTSVTIGNSVTNIENDAFEGCNNITHIEWNAKNCGKYYFEDQIRNQIETFVFGLGVEVIPSGICFEMSGLTSITIPNSVISIGGGAFNGCTNLTSVTIGNSVTSIDHGAFSGCTSLPVINNIRYADTYLVEVVNKTQPAYIKDGTKWIGEYAFSGCSGLTSVTIPNSVISIGEYAFSGCSGLTSVTIPNSVISIGEAAFGGCSGLKTIVVDDDNSNYCSMDGVLCNKDKTILIQYPTGSTVSSYTIPNSVTSIGIAAFYGCTGLTSVVIPYSVKNIDDYAFYDVPNVIYNGNATGSPWGAKNVIKGSLVENDWVYVDDSKKSIIGYVGKDTELILPNNVTTIELHALENMSFITSISLPQTMKIIGDSAFRNCSNLQKIICYSKRVPQVSEHTFDNVDKNNCILYVLADCINKYVDDYYWGDFMDIRPLQAKEVMTTEINAETADNSVVLTWPAITGATVYTIDIKKSGEPICTLSFNEQGQLLNISFAAPARNGERRSEPKMAMQTATGWQYTVSGLDANTTYTYTVTAKKSDETVAYQNTITFTTKNTPTAIDAVVGSGKQSVKVMHKGHIYILRDGKIYTVQGQEVK